MWLIRGARPRLWVNPHLNYPVIRRTAFWTFTEFRLLIGRGTNISTLQTKQIVKRRCHGGNSLSEHGPQKRNSTRKRKWTKKYFSIWSDLFFSFAPSKNLIDKRQAFIVLWMYAQLEVLRLALLALNLDLQQEHTNIKCAKNHTRKLQNNIWKLMSVYGNLNETPDFMSAQ